MLYFRSAKFAQKHDGNYSIYALAGIPVLLSAFRCLLIELNAGMYSDHGPKQDVLAKIAGDTRDIDIAITHYPVPEALEAELLLLWEVRNELVHPAHGPGTDGGMTPVYLVGLRDRKLLNSTGKDPDYTWIEQLKSHRLFRWAFSTIQQTVAVLLAQHNVQLTDPMGPTLYTTYSRYEETDRDIQPVA